MPRAIMQLPPPNPVAYRGGTADDFDEAEVRALAETARRIGPVDRMELLSYAVAEEGELVRLCGTVQVTLLGILVSGETERTAYDAWIAAAFLRLDGAA